MEQPLAADILSNQFKQKTELCQYISDNLYGNDEYIDGPFGPHKQVYCDYAASGKPVKFIEEYLEKEVYPIYANTHTSSSFTGIQMSCFREEAREIIRDTYHCTNDDVILFLGNGSTGAINAFIRILGIQKAGIPYNSVEKPYKCEFPGCKLCFEDCGDLRLHQRTHTDGDSLFNTINIENSQARTVNYTYPIESDHPIVFVGPYEHHSNLLGWRESQADVVVIPEMAGTEGGIDIHYLEDMLKKYQKRSLKIVSLSLCSNVTGIITDPEDISILVHQYGGITCWDGASACGHHNIYMNMTYRNKDNYMDALFLSPHKMVGGPGCPGILIVKKWLLTSEVPQEIGGGTIHFVSNYKHRYTYVLTDKEEGGTPNIIGDIKLGIVLHLHNSLGWDYIEDREKMMLKQTIDLWSKEPNIEILGKSHERGPIISILIKHNGYYLHWNYVSMLLSDLFGIQCRSGCMCAGPYSMHLLGIDQEGSNKLDHLLLNKNEIIRPGYTRISLSYALSDSELDYIQKAVLYVASRGYIYLPEYIYFSETAEWKHISIRNKKPYRRWINNIKFTDGSIHFPYQEGRAKISHDALVDPQSLFDEYLTKADALYVSTLTKIKDPHYHVAEVYTSDNTGRSVEGDVDSLRWFLTRYDIYNEIRNNKIEIENRNILIHTNILDADLENSRENEEGKDEKEIAMEIENKNNNNDKNNNNNNDNNNKGEEKKSFLIKSEKLKKKSIPSLCAASGREIVPANIAKLRGEEGVEFRYIEGEDGTIEYTAFVKGMTFEERARYMKTHKELFPIPDKKIMRLVGQANEHFKMIQEGDRVLLGLSGGKDSLTMLHVLLQVQKRSPVKFELACVTVDPQTTGFDPSPLRAYCHKLGVPYYYESRGIIKLAATKLQNNSICSFCSRMKRGVLYSTMRREHYNVLVLAQHLDDLCESFLMSVFHNGLLRTMKACYTVSRGDIRVVRPFVYLREKETREFAKGCELPIIDENCPACFEGPKERYRMKQLLASQENIYSNLYNSILSAMMPILSINSSTGTLGVHNTPRILRGKCKRSHDSELPHESMGMTTGITNKAIDDEMDDDEDIDM